MTLTGRVSHSVIVLNTNAFFSTSVLVLGLKNCSWSRLEGLVDGIRPISLNSMFPGTSLFSHFLGFGSARCTMDCFPALRHLAIRDRYRPIWPWPWLLCFHQGSIYSRLTRWSRTANQSRCTIAASDVFYSGLVLNILPFNGLNDIPHVMIQLSSVVKSFCSKIWSSNELIGPYFTRQSFANRRMVVPALRLLGMSLRKKRKRGLTPCPVKCQNPHSPLLRAPHRTWLSGEVQRENAESSYMWARVCHETVACT